MSNQRKLPHIELPAIVREKLDAATKEEAEQVAAEFIGHAIQRTLQGKMTTPEAIVNLLGAGLFSAAATKLPSKAEKQRRAAPAAHGRDDHAKAPSSSASTSTQPKHTRESVDVIDAEYTVISEEKKR